MDDGTGTEEEQCLEERMCHQVEDACGVGGDSDAHEHVAKLADRRISQHSFDVALADGDGGGVQGGDRTNGGYNTSRERSQLEERTGAGHHVDTSGDHSGGVDKGRDRGRTFHGVR